MKRVADSLSMASSLKSLASKTNSGPGDGAKTSGGTGDEDKEIARLKKQRQVAEDRTKLSKSEFVKKYSGLGNDFSKGAGYDGYSAKDLYDTFEGDTIEDYDTKIKNRTTGLEKQATERQRVQEQEAANRKEYDTAMSDLESRKKGISEKYKYNVDEKFQPVDYRQEYVKGVTSEAEQRIKNKQPIRLRGAKATDKDQMTCAKGVCTLAANQGVDFSKFEGGEGTYEIDEKGRKIPVQNKGFREKLASTGYEEIPYSQRQPGDIASFQFGGKDYTTHMEMVLNPKGNLTRYFNNYELANDPDATESGTSYRTLSPTAEGPGRNLSPDENVQNAFVYRLKPEAAKQAYLNKNPEYASKLQAFEAAQAAPEYKDYQQSLAKAEELKKKYPQYSSVAKK
jgi:hypothetical protein